MSLFRYSVGDWVRLVIGLKHSNISAVGEAEVMTSQEYDKKKYGEIFNNSLMGTVIVAGIHFYFGIVPPLILQLAMKPLKLYQDPLVKAYIFGEKVERPFPNPSPFAALTGNQDNANNNGN